ncbi:SirB2 family protein [Photobacterium sagamiensis]|uniref:SirB2 family protein n=1 Tax=Photobacterium sagamiensis TaxID=2910241 RepID=UPI003D0E7C38
MYSLILKAHLVLIILSFLSFVLRTWWGIKGSALLHNELALKAHKVITLLMLISALVLCFMISQYPFVDSWLTEKLGLLVAYVAFAMMAFRPQISAKSRYIFASIACGLFLTMFVIAKSHSPILLG